MITEIELFESPNLTPLGFCLWISMKGEVYKRKVDTTDELLTSILDSAARVNKREDQVRRSKRDFAHELRSAPRLTVGFSNIYCEL